VANVLIHRCTLRVVRCAGWNWGPDPRRLAQEAVRALPELLAKKLSELLPDDDDREIVAPVRIRLPVRMSELAADSAAQTHGAAPPGARASASLDQRMDAALRAALALDQFPPPPLQPQASDRGATTRFDEVSSNNQSREIGALPRLLLAWRMHGVLGRRLAALPFEVIEGWHDRIWNDRARRDAPETDAALIHRIEGIVLARSSPSASGDRAETLLHRILIAAEAAAQLPVPLTHFALWQTLDRIVPVEPSRPAPQVATQISVVANPIPAAPARRPPDLAGKSFSIAANLLSPAAFEPQPIEWEIKVPCALPFLLLGPLARVGYFAALDAVLEAAFLSESAPLFAAALAYKVLDPPQRGWRRSPASLLAAAALAGSTTPVAEESLVDFSRNIAPHISALDLTLADALIAGHTPEEPLMLHPDGSAGFLLFDTQGCFPIVWTGDFECLLRILRRFDSPIILITREAAEPGLLRHLDAGGIVFVSDVPPTRGERWQRIQEGSTVLGWTNSPGPATGPLRRAACETDSAFEDARGFTRDLVQSRTSVIRASSPELDRSLTLAASVALGMISWTLWQNRGRTSPQQVLERYADLEGRIRFTPTSINVSLPLGRRHQELRENGLLAPVVGVPWFGRRRVEFGGG
jgi:hypothetical protein